MRRWNLADDFKKFKDLVLAGKFGELRTRIFDIIPPLKMRQDRVVRERMRKKYAGYIDDHADKYRNITQGEGG